MASCLCIWQLLPVGDLTLDDSKDEQARHQSPKRGWRSPTGVRPVQRKGETKPLILISRLTRVFHISNLFDLWGPELVSMLCFVAGAWWWWLRRASDRGTNRTTRREVGSSSIRTEKPLPHYFPGWQVYKLLLSLKIISSPLSSLYTWLKIMCINVSYFFDILPKFE